MDNLEYPMYAGPFGENEIANSVVSPTQVRNSLRQFA